METRTGRLFDLGVDGLGFIAEDPGGLTWAFRYGSEGSRLADNREEFHRLEGEIVDFGVQGGSVASVVLTAPREAQARGAAV